MSDSTELIVGTRLQELILQPDRATSIADMLSGFQERWEEFRSLFKQQLILGEDYGTPPGIRPGNDVPGQWVSKPSLYQAGADKAIQLLGVTLDWEPSPEMWRMSGEKPGTFFVKVNLMSQGGRLIGSGVGAGSIGGRMKADENTASKMALKRAKVSAVLNSFGLTAMFSQDLEDLDNQPDHNPPPPQSAKATKAPPPRTQRVTKDQVAKLFEAWKRAATANGEDVDFSYLAAWVNRLTNMDIGSVKFAENWTMDDLDKCWEDLGGVQ